jgi:hypothetical protein
MACAQLFPFCTLCNNQACRGCQAEYVLVDGVCQCEVGFFVDGFCTEVAGCTSVMLTGAGVECTGCNSAYYAPLPRDD